MHETAFQDFLIRYFCFRRAYCDLKIEFKGILNLLIFVLFPFRRLIPNKGKLKLLNSTLKLVAWSKGLKK